MAWQQTNRDTALRVKDNDAGIIVGFVAYPLTPEQRRRGERGYTVDEWRRLSNKRGGASRYPLRDNHGADVGRLLQTIVDQDGAGRVILAAVAQVDMQSDGGRRVWAKILDGTYWALSWRFDQYMPEQANGNAYKNRFIEVSVTDDPKNPEALIQSICSNSSAMSATITDAAVAPPAATAPAVVATTPAVTAPAVAVPQTPQPMDQDAAAVAPDMLPWIKQAATMTPEELTKLSAQTHAANQDAQRRLAQAEQQMKQQADELAAFRQQRAAAEQAEQQRITKQLETDLPLLKAAGFAEDDHAKQLLLALATAPQTQTIYQQQVKIARELAESREAQRRAAEESRRANALFNFLPSAARPAAASTGRRAQPAAAEEAPSATARSDRSSAQESAIAMLGLNKFNPNAARVAASQPAAAAPAPTEDAHEPPELRMNTNDLTAYFSQLQQLIALAAKGQQVPVPVACSKSSALQKPTTIKVPHGFGTVDVLAPWQIIEFWHGKQDEIDAKIKQYNGHQGWNYNDSGAKQVVTSVNIPREEAAHWFATTAAF